MIKQFPEFSALQIEDRQEFNDYVDNFPPYSDIQFSTLQTWWNIGGQLAASWLNGNLVIRYDLPQDERNSGLGLVGTKDVDESIVSVLEFLKENDQESRLVHVTEFVLDALKDQHQFDIEEEKDYSEYVLDAKSHYELSGSQYSSLRHNLSTFMRRFGDTLEVQDLDISNPSVVQEINGFVDAINNKYPTKNDVLRQEKIPMNTALRLVNALELQNFAVYIDGQFAAFVIYERVKRKCIIGHHLKADYDFPHISDFIYHELSRRAIDSSINNINIEMDLGIEGLRQHKLKLKPSIILKKYSLSPINTD